MKDGGRGREGREGEEGGEREEGREREEGGREGRWETKDGSEETCYYIHFCPSLPQSLSPASDNIIHVVQGFSGDAPPKVDFLTLKFPIQDEISQQNPFNISTKNRYEDIFRVKTLLNAVCGAKKVRKSGVRIRWKLLKHGVSGKEALGIFEI